MSINGHLVNCFNEKEQKNPKIWHKTEIIPNYLDFKLI